MTMIDKDAIKELSKSESIRAACDAVDFADSVVALPNDFTVHDLEKFLLYRRRPRGAMLTPILEDFAAYVAANKAPGAAAFVDPEHMAAVAVLNLGTPELPGHADNTAKLKLEPTAEYSALVKAWNSPGLTQQDAAEFIEDWQANITCTKGLENVPAAKAVAAIRKITVESKKAGESQVQTFSAQRSTLESITASSAEPLPEFIEFKCIPYVGIAERTFRLRVGILTGGSNPALKLRVINGELHYQQMADELAMNVRKTVKDIPVHIGSYAAKA